MQWSAQRQAQAPTDTGNTQLAKMVAYLAELTVRVEKTAKCVTTFHKISRCFIALIKLACCPATRKHYQHTHIQLLLSTMHLSEAFEARRDMREAVYTRLMKATLPI